MYDDRDATVRNKDKSLLSQSDNDSQLFVLIQSRQPPVENTSL